MDTDIILNKYGIQMDVITDRIKSHMHDAYHMHVPDVYLSIPMMFMFAFRPLCLCAFTITFLFAHILTSMFVLQYINNNKNDICIYLYSM